MQYAKAVDLPEPAFQSAAAQSVEVPAGRAVVVVGSQLTEFAPAVSPASRAAITDSSSIR